MMNAMSHEQFANLVAFNKQLHDSDPDKYETAQLLALIGAVAARLGNDDLSSLAIALSNTVLDDLNQQ